MAIELNQLVEQFTKNNFKVQGVYYNKIKPKKTGFQKSAPFPGFIFPIKGEAKYHFAGTPYITKPGNIVHGGANMDLGKEVLSDESWECITVLYDINYSKKENLNLEDAHFELNIGGNPRIIALLWKLRNVSEEEHTVSKFQTENIFRFLLEEIFLSIQNQQKNGTQGLFIEVSSYVQNHYMDNITVKGLAEKYGVSENQIYYIFNKYANMGSGEYIKKCRLDFAKKLLVESDYTIAEIAESVGYLDPLYFSRIFKKSFGMPPSIYRKKIKNNPYEIQDSSIPK